MTHEIPPDELIDRASELEEFLSMLEFQDEARLLTICDKPGTGKSDLLRKLEFSCRQRGGAVAAARVKLDERTITDEYTLVQRIRQELKRAKAPFPLFDYYDDRRMNHDWEPFAAPAPEPPLAGVAGVIDLREAKVQGGEFVTVKTSGPVTVNTQTRSFPQWASPDQEQMARERCVEAFLDDLRGLSSQQAVVLLLDTFETHAHGPLGEWLMDELVWPFCIDESRPERFVLVVAGQTALKLDARLPKDRGQLVRSRNALTWEDDHVRAFLALHGYGHLKAQHVEVVCDVVRDGASISQALKLAEAFPA